MEINSFMNHKTANLDFFLYSCMESERTLASYSDERQKELRYSGVAGFQRGENVPDAIAEQELDALIDGAFDFHKAECPEIGDDDPVYLKDLHILSPQVVYLLKDVQAAIEAKTGGRVPSYKSDGDQEEVWQQIDRRIEDTFGTYKKEFVKDYFHWSFSDWEEEKVELGDRPPVGRYMPYAFRRNMRDSRGGDRGGRGGDRGRPGRGGDRGGRGGDRDRGRGGRSMSNGRDRDDRGGRGRDRGDRNGGRGRGGDRDRGGRNGGRDRDGGHSKAEIDQCTQQVQEAVDQLKANGNLDQVQLPPTNSYFRRLQHKQIKEHGFESASTGEGNGRAVVLKRI